MSKADKKWPVFVAPPTREVPPLTTPEEVASYMRLATSRDDWLLRAGDVQDAFGGQYPLFWHSTIITSGLLGGTQRKWLGRPVA